MKIVVDTSVILAVLFGEPDRDVILSLTKDCDLVSSETLPFEIANALLRAFRRSKLSAEDAQTVLQSFGKMKVSLQAADHLSVVGLAHDHSIYAYDAFMIEVARSNNCHLFTLDKKMREVARAAGVKVLEV